MNAWEYHNKFFRQDLQEFFSSLERGPRTRNGGDRIVRDPRYSFHVEDLILARGYDHLVHISKEHIAYFAVSLTYVVMINQIVHAHFPHLHEQFWQITRYPLIAGGMNPSRLHYVILDDCIWLKRKVFPSEILAAWKELVCHLKEDILEFETIQGLRLGLIWQDFSRVSLNDPDIVGYRTRENLDKMPKEYGCEIRKTIKSVLEAGGAEYGQEKRRSRRP
jgi:hypothetical protein